MSTWVTDGMEVCRALTSDDHALEHSTLQGKGGEILRILCRFGPCCCLWMSMGTGVYLSNLLISPGNLPPKNKNSKVNVQ